MTTKKQHLSKLIKPRSIAVIGASRYPEKVGYQVVNNIIKAGYTGNLYLINPNANQILGYRCYPTLFTLPRSPECVIIVTPRDLVLPILEECVRLKVNMVIIITAGFSESGRSGQNLQAEIKQVIRNSKTRVLGPNCLGIINPHFCLNASFGPSIPIKGSVFLISQSGALITGIFDWAAQRRLGFSGAVSLGNRVDLSENDFLSYAASDKRTKVIAVYLESFSSAKAFFTLASKIRLHKPVLLLKGGVSAAGVKASQSHTAALASSDVLVKSLSRQSGVLEFNSIESWLSACLLFTSFPHGCSKNLAIVTNAGGPGVLTTDYASAKNFTLHDPNQTVASKLEKALQLSSIHNPLDLLGDAPPSSFYEAVNIFMHDPSTDIILVIITPQSMTQPAKIALLLSQAFSHPKKPLVFSFIGGEQMQGAKKIASNAGFPVFDYPNDAVDALSYLQTYAALSQRKNTLTTAVSIADNNFTLVQDQAAYFQSLKNYGLKIPKYRFIHKLESIPDALAYVGRPALMKTADPSLAHKALYGGVIPSIMTVSQGRVAFRKLHTLYPKVLVQQTIYSSLELILGAKRDRQFNSFITVGLGGSYTDILSDRAYIFIPCSQSAYLQAFKQTQAYEIIAAAGLSSKPILQTIGQLSNLFLNNPNLQEIEINPLLCTKQACYAVDIKVTYL